MEKTIFYKEWIKTRWYFILSTLVSCLFAAYCMLGVGQIIRGHGPLHVWQVMLERDAVFINRMAYIPVLLGLLLAVFQFVPEVVQKRLKLTLHLPYPQYRMIAVMLGYGTVLLLTAFLLNLAIIGGYMQTVVTHELVWHVILTALPWYVAGLAAYYLTAWICLEPTWKRRIVYILLSLGVLRVFFLTQVPESYNHFLPILLLYTLMLALFSMLSVYRFKTGEQD